MSQRRRDQLRPLVVVYSANPRSSASVPKIGYRIAANIGDLTDATFVFHAMHRKDLTGWFPEDRVTYAGSRRLAEGLRRIGSRLFPEAWGAINVIEFLDYLVFDIDCYRKARSIVKKKQIDFALRVTPTSPRYASLLAYLRIPVFTGPHNGGMRWPAGFRFLDKKEKTMEGLRFLGDIMHKLYGDTGRYAGIFCANEITAQTIEPAYRSKAIFIAENAIEELGEQSPHAGDANRLLYVGRLVPFKVPDLVLKALSRLPSSVHLTFVGDGPERPGLEKLAAELGVQDRCDFVGFKPNGELGKYFSEAGVFVFPSVRECGGMVVLEAMSHGLPCVVADWGGPAKYTKDTGIQLSVNSPEILTDELVDTLTRLLEDPAEGRRVGEAAREKIRNEYVWSSKAQLLVDAICERINITLVAPGVVVDQDLWMDHRFLSNVLWRVTQQPCMVQEGRAVIYVR